jgi:hypothetical protein
MLFPGMQDKITDVAEYQTATNVALGTEAGHARSAVRAILGLVRLTGGDMERVEKILAEYFAMAWRGSGCEQVTEAEVAPIFTRDEVLSAARAAQDRVLI